MTEASKTCKQTTLPGIPAATSSPESPAGNLPSGLPDGKTAAPFGPAPVPVSRFRAQDRGKAMPINDTSGPLFNASSPSASLQRYLGSKLRRNLAGNGSPLYVLTWSTWDMPSGVPISRLRASARRTSGNASGGWPTPRAQEPGRTNEGYGKSVGMVAREAGWPTPNAGPQNDTDTKWQERRARIKAEKKNGNGFGMTLGMASSLTGWTIPQANEPSSRTRPSRKGRTTEYLGRQVQAAGWETPKVLNIKRSAAFLKGCIQLSPLEALAGESSPGFPVRMAKRGQLNPDFTRWLMGYPEEWASCAPTGTPSSPK